MTFRCGSIGEVLEQYWEIKDELTFPDNSYYINFR